MKKILIVTVKLNSAIDRLAYSVRDLNKHLDIKVLPVHPKRPDNLEEYKKLAGWADVIDYEYWKSAEMLSAKFPEIKKPSILSHYNPYDLQKSGWKNYDILVAPNKEIQKELKEFTKKEIEYIPLAVDLNFWEWGEVYDTKVKRVLMVSQRIEGKKGIREVAWACYQLGYEFVLVGLISSPDYFNQIMTVNPNTQWMSWVSDEDLRELYQNASLHICNSIDNFESGSLPVLEAMACGCPVLSRKIGHIPDIYNGENLEIYEGQTEEKERLKVIIKSLMENKEKRLKLRDKGWETAKLFSSNRRALRYSKLFNRVYFQENKLVSVIIPTTNEGVEQVKQILNALEKQTYKNIEAIVCFDEFTPTILDIKNYSYPIKFISTGKTEKYGLAKARNLGVIESEGEYIVFCDNRLCPELDAVQKYVAKMNSKSGKVWFYGNKGKDKKTFVENWSCVRRQDIINAGMFAQWITIYGGMTQEIRGRVLSQGFELIYTPEIKCAELKSSGKRNKEKRKSIVRMKDKLFRMNL